MAPEPPALSAPDPLQPDPQERREQALVAGFERDGRFSQVFVVLTIGAVLIATLGLLANSPGVVIGAMVVAPWILPLQAMAFAVVRGRLDAVLQASLTLLLGVTVGLLLSLAVGLLVSFPLYGSEVINRTSPNLLDLGVALVAGGVAIYARLRQEAISALAGLAIAVALVPPICVVGLLLAAGQWGLAKGALLLFITNLLGILVGAMTALGLLERSYRSGLLHSRLGITSVLLTALLVLPLGGSFLNLLQQARQRAAAQQVRELIETRLRQSTVTFGRDCELVDLTIDWNAKPPLVRARVRVSDPELPTPAQVAAVQTLINRQLAPQRFRLLAERTAVEVVGP